MQIRSKFIRIYTILAFAFYLIFAVIPNSALISDPAQKISSTSLNWKDFKLDGLRLEADTQGLLFLQLEDRKIMGEAYHNDFEKKQDGYLLDSTIFYKGNFSARFTGTGSQLKISRGTNGLFLEPEIRENMYFSFYIYPSAMQDHSVLMEKTIFRSGLEYGFRLLLKGKTLEIDLLKFLQTTTIKSESETIIANNNLKPRFWNHVVIEFRPSDNSVLLFLNGREVGRNSKNSGEIIGFGFHPDDKTPLLVGKNFYGNLDEFVIARGQSNIDHLNSSYAKLDYDPNSKNSNQKFGTALSPVYKTEFSHASLLKTQIESKLPKDSLLEVWFRASLEPFAAYESSYTKNIQWNPLEDFLKKKPCSLGHNNQLENCFRYYQWKVIMRSDPNGENSPKLSAVHSYINLSLPPKQITGVKFLDSISALNRNQVCLQWNASDNPLVWNGGGYLIHFGFEKNTIVATIPYQQENNSQESSSKSETRPSTIQTCLNNEIISSQAENFAKEQNLPFFSPGKTVYFRVSGYNRFWSWTGSGKDQVGKISEPVVVSFPTTGQ